MRSCVIAGGPNIYPEAVSLIKECDKVICADSGADFAISQKIAFDAVYGDMDSISEGGKQYLVNNKITKEVFPCEKDDTDTELALKSLDVEDELLLICSLSGRPDHVLANMNLAMKLHEQGRRITISDGITDIIPMVGNETITIGGCLDTSALVVSLVPMNPKENVMGVTTKGLYYALENATLSFGSTFSISNKLFEDADGFAVSMQAGHMFLIISRDS